MRRVGWVTPVGLPQVRVMAVVEQLRHHRGRLTRRELAQVLGWNPNERRHMVLLNQIVRDFAITVKDAGRVDPMAGRRPSGYRRGAELQAAREALAREIRLAQIEAPYAPPYRTDPDY